MKKDLFISHASEDKDDFVRPLANLLKDYGVDVWYDEFELRIGVSISRSIDKGIKNSNFGLIVLSKSFFEKSWTEYELKSLNSFEVDNADVLLPIWKDVTVKEVRNFSPYLADKFSLNSKTGIETVAIEIVKVVRPDLFTKIRRKEKLEEILKNGKVEYVDPKKLKKGPIQHHILSENLISRIRLIRSALWLGFPGSMVSWVDDFKRDTNVENEILFWENLAASFLEIITQHDLEKSYLGKEDIYKDLFALIFIIKQSPDTREIKKKFKPEFVKIVEKILSYNLPIYDINDTPATIDNE